MPDDDVANANPSRGRGRPRTFDRARALEAAMHAFWRQGFDATSMIDLVEAMGIASPSIYSAFGSKEQLFQEALALYVHTYGTILREALLEEEDLRISLRRAFHGVLDLLGSFEAPRGCLVVLGLGPFVQNAMLKRAISEARSALRDALKDRFEVAVQYQDGPVASDIEAAVEACMSFYNGLSIEMLDGVPRDTLKSSVDLFTHRIVARKVELPGVA